LSWLTILRKRENYRQAFDLFAVEKVAAYSQDDVQRLLNNSGIVRNRLKIASAIKNGQGVLAIIEEFGSLDAFLWRYVEGIPRQNQWQSMAEVPTRTNISDALSKDLKQRGFNFIGTTICYSFMQAIGMVNDHLVGCFRHGEVSRLAETV
jgi:DNA-3-methyladenine glycosylase I